jgi:hypothetical protein
MAIILRTDYNIAVPVFKDNFRLRLQHLGLMMHFTHLKIYIFRSRHFLFLCNIKYKIFE